MADKILYCGQQELTYPADLWGRDMGWLLQGLRDATLAALLVDLRNDMATLAAGRDEQARRDRLREETHRLLRR